MSVNIQVTNSAGKILPVQANLITQEILAASAVKLSVTAKIPITGVTAVWHAGDLTTPNMRLPWFLDSQCGANHSMPLIIFLDQNFSASYAIGLTNGIDDSQFSCKLNQESCCYEVTIRIVIDPETTAFEVFFDESKRPMTDVLDDYRRKLMPELPAFPAAAWDPVYCTWYAVHAALTETYLKRNAEEAAGLGFGTFIVDDGWCFDEAKRVTPKTLPEWYRDIGDWDYSRNKLPELKKVVEHAQHLGLNYMFWVSPFFVGKRSALNDKVSLFRTGYEGGQRTYDPADAAANEVTMNAIFDIFKSMELDGVKIDFIDIIHPDVDQPLCRNIKRYLETLIGKMREFKPDALIEFRQKYATPVNAGLATAFRAGDVPFDYMENFSRCVQLRLILGDNIPVHADPVYFNSQESCEAVGRHLIASLAGVPMLSMELSTISAEHKQVIRNYIDFYNRHRELLNHGHWEFDLRNGFPAAAICRNADECIIILTDDAMLERNLKNCPAHGIILNMSANPIRFAGKTFDAQGNDCGNSSIPSGGRGEF